MCVYAHDMHMHGFMKSSSPAGCTICKCIYLSRIKILFLTIIPSLSDGPKAHTLSSPSLTLREPRGAHSVT